MFVLGCSGVGDAITAVSGMDVQTGANATLPDGFPFPAPADGELVSVATLPMGGKKMTTVTWTIQDTTKAEALYKDWFKSAGVDVQTQEQSVLGTKTLTMSSVDGTKVVTISDQGGQKSVSAIVTE
jgi:hypothetical protein